MDIPKKAQQQMNALTPVISQIVAEYTQAHALDGVMALYQRLRDECGSDTNLQIICIDGGRHVHVSTYGTCEACD